jgi:UDP-3-O-[3-hydroxymyristoyl] glucosamine N-acyltransferase
MFKKYMKMIEKVYTLEEVANHLNAKLIGDPTCKVKRFAPLSSAKLGDITFLNHSKYKAQLKTTKASAVILNASHAKDCCTNHLIMKNPYLGFAKAAQLFYHTPPLTPPGIHPTAVIGQRCLIDKHVNIGAYTVIGDHVHIQTGTTIGAHSVIGQHVTVGKNCFIHANTTIEHHVIIKNRVIIHSGAVIGSDGFGMAPDEQGKWVNIPQQGKVILGDDVDIGANTTIDRGTLEDTVIDEGVKIDNLVQVAHNVHIGAHTAIAACTGIAGSTTIGKHCILAGAARISGHLTIADQVIITAMSGVSKSIDKPGIYSSHFSAEPHMQWQRKRAKFHHLHELLERVKKLESRYDKN